MEPKPLLTFEQTKDKALRLLSFRAHSEKELADKLRRNGASEDNIHKVLDFARQYHFVNDAEYAKMLARDLTHLKKYGLNRVRMELRRKGIDEEHIEEAVSGLDIDSETILLPLLEKRLKGNLEKKNIDKAIRYFLYRGYSFQDIQHCIKQLKTDHKGEDLWDIT